MAEPEPTPRQRLRADHCISNRVALHRLDPALRAPDRKIMKSPGIILNQTLRGIGFAIPLVCREFSMAAMEKGVVMIDAGEGD
ncbi:hypothetical protein [Novosphingobium album (ex Liu et al. 2023)]|uniref:Uncharacterized protein n=1 Tax=Novosphingobium album (ex Liu et al. 2023) TaxID=3031130 RepID=A0ABT5WUZ3_9SPHN|nr:hypothetical protein [Novosphingobium album (ex Liu et al. 2023)]MDE8653691.1 hypothetical protein [Novosphingobium album (ex Liu et al. 2023)]